jgi:hypothetical protein
LLAFPALDVRLAPEVVLEKVRVAKQIGAAVVDLSS